MQSVPECEAKAEDVRRFCRLNVSDSAAHSFRTSLLAFRAYRWLEDGQRRDEHMVDMIRNELNHCITTLDQHPAHESVWIALQGVLHVCGQCLVDERVKVKIIPTIFLPLVGSSDLMEELRAWELFLRDSKSSASSSGSQGSKWRARDLLLAWALQFARSHVHFDDPTATDNSHALRFAAKTLSKVDQQNLLSSPHEKPVEAVLHLKAEILRLLICVCPMQEQAWRSMAN
mmetsp:Transcript_7575/g.25774  ORF Transcript_7575/g.25774 Transcript_7575/m.25774 type:complete len:230 (+) Transcript_7575:688-1377(+)